MKYALIGEKLGHSYSKIIHEKYFSIKSMDSSYDLIEIPSDELEARIKSIVNDGYKGFNVTIPYKIDLMNMCSELCEEAEKIGSVNTINISGGKMTGYNPDYHGLRLALEYNGVDIKDKAVVVLGTGGASKAVVALCEDLGAKEITLVSRSPKNEGKHKNISYSSISGGDVIINTPPVGMYPNIDASPYDKLDPFKVAVDLIYNPSETRFLKKAKDLGLKTVNGLYMLVAQALFSESIWNREKLDIDAINKIYAEMGGK